jgi:D-alanyl-D-alanine carboxypeptidase
VRLAREPPDLSATAWGNAAAYHPGWVYHGLLVGTPAEAVQFRDGLLTGRLLEPALLQAMLESRPVGGPVEGRRWRTPAYGLGLMADVMPPRGRCIGHTGGGRPARRPRTTPGSRPAAFASVDDLGIVERAALGLP